MARMRGARLPDCAQGPTRNGQQGVDLPLLLLLPLRLHRALQSEL